MTASQIVLSLVLLYGVKKLAEIQAILMKIAISNEVLKEIEIERGVPEKETSSH